MTQNSYTDNNQGTGLTEGIRYCYMIVAYYSDKAQSYASNEACAHLKKDVAVITNVSVTTTDASSGAIYVAWSKPTEIDTTQAPDLINILSIGPFLQVLVSTWQLIPSQI